ncbi:MAG: hypothetical protein HY608_04770 [Planctomycetes bacterium]|nr:hypothetical protein [Planctomycetota bacterium]
MNGPIGRSPLITRLLAGAAPLVVLPVLASAAEVHVHLPEPIGAWGVAGSEPLRAGAGPERVFDLASGTYRLQYGLNTLAFEVSAVPNGRGAGRVEVRTEDPQARAHGGRLAIDTPALVPLTVTNRTATAWRVEGVRRSETPSGETRGIRLLPGRWLAVSGAHASFAFSVAADGTVAADCPHGEGGAGILTIREPWHFFEVHIAGWNPQAGAWRIPGVIGPTDAPGASLRISCGRYEFVTDHFSFPFEVTAAGGVLCPGDASAWEGALRTLRIVFPAWPVLVDWPQTPAAWAVCAVPFPVLGDRTVHFRPGAHHLHYGNNNQIAFAVGFDGTVTTASPLATGGRGILTVRADRLHAVGVSQIGDGRWSFVQGGALLPAASSFELALLPGHWQLRRGVDFLDFALDEGGLVTTSAPWATGGLGSLSIHEIGVRVTWPPGAGRHAVSGSGLPPTRDPETVHVLIPGAHQVRVGTTVVAGFNLGTDGTVTTASPGVFGGTASLAFDPARVVPFAVHFPSAGTRWEIPGVTDGETTAAAVPLGALPGTYPFVIERVLRFNLTVNPNGTLTTRFAHATTNGADLFLADPAAFLHDVTVAWPYDWFIRFYHDLFQQPGTQVVTLPTGRHLFFNGPDNFSFDVSGSGFVTTAYPYALGGDHALSFDTSALSRQRPVTVTWAADGPWRVQGQIGYTRDVARTINLLPGIYMFQSVFNTFFFWVDGEGNVTETVGHATGGFRRLAVGPEGVHTITLNVYAACAWRLFAVTDYDAVRPTRTLRLIPGLYTMQTQHPDASIDIRVGEDGIATSNDPRATSLGAQILFDFTGPQPPPR